MNKVQKIVYTEVKGSDALAKVKYCKGFMNYLKFSSNGITSALDALVAMLKPEIEELIFDSFIYGNLQENSTTVQINIGKKDVRLIICCDDITEANKMAKNG